jgi:hypothetical protein
MTPRLRKLALTTHVTFSVGWLGAVAAFLVLSIAGLRSQDAEVVRGAYLSMDLIGRFIIVPMSLAALATGLIQALGTQWGLFQHYWVLVKFLLTILATAALLLHQFTAVEEAANRVSGTAAGTLPGTELSRLGTQLVGDASLAILVLLAVTTLSVFKPWGLTRYGRRKQQERRKVPQSPDSPQTLQVTPVPDPDNEAIGRPSLGLKIALAVVAVVVVVFVVLHLAGGGLGNHGH